MRRHLTLAAASSALAALTLVACGDAPPQAASTTNAPSPSVTPPAATPFARSSAPTATTKSARRLAERAIALGTLDDVTDPLVRRPRANAAAQKAVQLAPTLAAAHAALGFVRYRFDWQWTEAEAEFQKAVGADPDDAFSRHQYGVFLATIGRQEDGLRELKRALALDPDSPVIRADILAAEGRTNGSVASQPRIIERRIAQLTRELEDGPSPPKSYRLATDLALAHASLKHRDQTLQWLAVAIDLHEAAPLYMRSSAAFDFVRDHPQFNELLRRAKLDTIR